jgi:SM-20-related protein
MPSAAFFASLGFFVRASFVSAEECRQLIFEASEAPHEPCRVVRHGVDDVLDEHVRNTTSALVSRETRLRLKQRFIDVVPELETHFRTALAGSETPGFLIYDAGAFFAAHSDAGAVDPPDIRRRRVSAVLFLNAPSADPGTGTYGGGVLKFHRLLDGPHWEGCSFAFERPEPGMLVAFRSDLVHEVLPVTFGRRFTVVTWFPERDTQPAAI